MEVTNPVVSHPDAPEDALVAVPTDPVACNNCGKTHPYVTVGCQPALWAGRIRNFLMPGEWFSSRQEWRMMVPPHGLVGAVIGEDGNTIAVVRSTSWHDEARDPTRSVEPYSWSQSGGE